MTSTSGLGFDDVSSDSSEEDHMDGGPIVHDMFRRKRSLTGREDARMQKEITAAGRRSFEEMGFRAAGWKHVAARNRRLNLSRRMENLREW